MGAGGGSTPNGNYFKFFDNINADKNGTDVSPTMFSPIMQILFSFQQALNLHLTQSTNTLTTVLSASFCTVSRFNSVFNAVDVL